MERVWMWERERERERVHLVVGGDGALGDYLFVTRHTSQSTYRYPNSSQCSRYCKRSECSVTVRGVSVALR